MDTLTLFLISAVLSLWIVWQITQTNKRTDDSNLPFMQFASNTITGMLIIVLLYTNSDMMLLASLLVICLPFTLYNHYHIYKRNKRKFVTSVVVSAGLIVIILTTAYF